MQMQEFTSTHKVEKTIVLNSSPTLLSPVWLGLLGEEGGLVGFSGAAGSSSVVISSSPSSSPLLARVIACHQGGRNDSSCRPHDYLNRRHQSRCRQCS